MSGTGELDAQSTADKLAVLIERSKTTERFIQTANQSLTGLTDIINRIERTQIQHNESLTARSEANRLAIVNLDAKVDHKDQSSIARDRQQVEMLREEGRERETALAEQDARHAKDIESIRADIQDMSEKLENSVFWNRIMAGAATLMAMVAGAAITAGVNHLFP